MNVLVILLVPLAIFWLGYRFYARYICKVFDVDDCRLTPAVAMEDGVDYVPTKPMVVFGHHFASIAGAGPIIGPAIALVYGWWPCVLWIVLGTVLIGSVHDLTATLTSIREKGKSIAELAKDALGPAGFFLIISFTLIIVLIVCAAFLELTATALTSEYPLSDLGLGEGQTLFRINPDSGLAVVGGIASSKVIGVTILAPILGWLLYRRGVSVLLASAIAIVVIVICLIIGIAYPLTLSPGNWKLVFSLYTLIAAGIPVWFILQPRDFINSFILYAGIILMVIGAIFAGFKGIPMQLDGARIAEGTAVHGPIWPMLFILIACGAISGFHALVAGGTTSKQIGKESHAKKIGYGGMVLEGILALGVVIAIAVGLDSESYMRIVYPPELKGNPILAFAVGLGNLLDKSVGLPVYIGAIFGVVMVEGFIATTLDTAVRLSRYLFEELWHVLIPKPPAFLRSYLFNAALAVTIMYLLAMTETWKKIWAVFGAGNQLLAALTLTVISVWLLQRNKPAWFTIIPGAIMLVTTVTALVWMLLTKYIPEGQTILIIADVLLLALSAGSMFISVRSILKHAPKTSNPVSS